MRREMKVKMLAEDALTGLSAVPMKHSSRQEHAKQRVRGPQGRFLGAPTERATQPTEAAAKGTGGAHKEAKRSLLRIPSPLPNAEHCIKSYESGMGVAPGPLCAPLCAPPGPLIAEGQEARMQGSETSSQHKQRLLSSIHAISHLLVQQQCALRRVEKEESHQR